MTASVDQIRSLIIDSLPRLRRFARALALDRDDADDLVQLSVERALKECEHSQLEVPFETLMFGIVRSTWINEVRAGALRSARFTGDQTDAGLAPADLSTYQSMAALPEEQRMAVALVLIEGFSYSLASQVLDISIAELTSQLALARDALNASLDD